MKFYEIGILSYTGTSQYGNAKQSIFVKNIISVILHALIIWRI